MQSQLGGSTIQCQHIYLYISIHCIIGEVHPFIRFASLC